MLVPMIPVLKPKEKDAAPEMPKESNCYLVAKNGVFHQVRNDFYEVRSKVEGPAGLAELKECVKLHVVKMSVDLFKKAESFLHAAWKKHEGEAAILLAYHVVNKEWRLIVPPQKGSSASVEYDPTKVEVPEGFELFGTIHSHPTFSAFHSGTDDKDEFGFDGLHITIGNLNTPSRSYATRWILNGRSFKCDLTNCVENVEDSEFDKSWLDRVEKKSYGTTTGTYVNPNGQGGFGHGQGNHIVSGPPNSAFDSDKYWREKNQQCPPAGTKVLTKEERQALIEKGRLLVDKPAHQLSDDEFAVLQDLCSDLCVLQEALAIPEDKTKLSSDIRESVQEQRALDFREIVQDATVERENTAPVVLENVRVKGGTNAGALVQELARHGEEAPIVRKRKKGHWKHSAK